MIPKLLGRIKRRLWPPPTDHRGYAKMSVPDTFRKIYQNRVWGDNGEPFYSGNGSRGKPSDLYCEVLASFLKENPVRTIIDCGCGDFTVGRRILELTDAQYIGVDVVPELIEHHRKAFQDPRVSFVCADMITDDLPAADLCLVRQVLQHLTNAEIAEVLARLSRFPKVLITEDVPIQPSTFNHDMTHGPAVRWDWESGVYVDQPPFSVPVREIARFPLTDVSVLRTVLLDNTGLAAA